MKNAGYRPTKISGLATYDPPRLHTNKDLEKLVNTSDEWILQRTGIRERHIVVGEYNRVGYRRSDAGQMRDTSRPEPYPRWRHRQRGRQRLDQRPTKGT